ncbi:MAG: hypothetical protein HQL70_00835 [Magnetococcales bacterium]|nr:hypothetical protein [Magnetococcales bacterium]
MRHSKILAGVVMLCGILTALPPSDAFAVGSWSYPQSEDEREKRESALEAQLADLEKNYQDQYSVVTEKKSQLIELIEKIKLAGVDLEFQKKPLQEAIEKYRQVQKLSLIDPMVSTEPQRMELLEIKRETSDQVAAFEEKQQILMEKLPKAKANVKVAVEQHKHILQEIDSLMRHRDAVRELVFVRNVAD